MKLNYPAELFQSYQKKHIELPADSTSSSSEEKEHKDKEHKEKKDKK